MSTLVTRIFELIFIIGMPVIIVYVLVPAFKRWLGEDKLSIAHQIAVAAVAMIEQLGDEMPGAHKFEAAFNYAKRLAAWRGIEIDDDLLSGLIEAAVYLLKKGNS
jgi:LL-H family phage holin